MRTTLAAAAAMLVTGAMASPALALKAGLNPVSGDGFQVVNGSAAGTGRRSGSIQNDSPQFRMTVGATLGGASSAHYGFTVVGTGNGGTITCTIIPESPQLDGGWQVFQNATSVTGTFSLFIDTNLPAGQFTFYNVECDLPPLVNGVAARIRGAYPQQSLPTFLMPTSGAGFGTSATSQNPQATYSGWFVENPSTTQSLLIESSIGRYNPQAKMQIFGRGNGGLVVCDVLVTTLSGGGVPLVFTGSRMVNGPFQLDILTGAVNELAFYSVRCSLPPANGAGNATLFGVAPDR